MKIRLVYEVDVAPEECSEMFDAFLLAKNEMLASLNMAVSLDDEVEVFSEFWINEEKI